MDDTGRKMYWHIKSSTVRGIINSMIVVDMESSGLDPNKHSLLSVGAVDFLNPTNIFYAECRLFEGAHVDPGALAVNGFSREEIVNSGKQTEGDLTRSFLLWSEGCKERTIAGQNPSADRDFLRASAHRNHLDWQFAYRTVDLHSVAYMHMLKRREEIPMKHGHSALNLDKILVYCGLPEEPKPHNGLRGATYEAEAFHRLFFDKPLLPDFKDFNIPWLSCVDTQAIIC